MHVILKGWLLILAEFVSLTGCFCDQPIAQMPDEVPMPPNSINDASTPFSISELFLHCRIPGECGKPVDCEGREVWVQGMIDRDNVFDRLHYPQLDYEKFRLVDPESRMMLEIFVELADSSWVFRELLGPHGNQAPAVIVMGRVVGVDMPTTGQCLRGIALVLDESGALNFPNTK